MCACMHSHAHTRTHMCARTHVRESQVDEMLEEAQSDLGLVVLQHYPHELVHDLVGMSG